MIGPPLGSRARASRRRLRSYAGHMPVSKRDHERMAFLAKASAELEKETGPASPEFRRWVIRFVNPHRAEIGLPPLEEDDDEPPELEFFRRARARGMLRSR
jgi:hypothetical protein